MIPRLLFFILFGLKFQHLRIIYESYVQAIGSMFHSDVQTFLRLAQLVRTIDYLLYTTSILSFFLFPKSVWFTGLRIYLRMYLFFEKPLRGKPDSYLGYLVTAAG